MGGTGVAVGELPPLPPDGVEVGGTGVAVGEPLPPPDGVEVGGTGVAVAVGE